MSWRLATLLVTIASCAEAGSVYRFYIPHAGAVRRIEWTGAAGGWDVSVRLDRERCELYCVYQRNGGPFGAAALAYYLSPPAVTIQIYTDPASRPRTIVVDPAGSGRSRITSGAATRIGQACLTGADPAAAVPLCEARRAPPAALRLQAAAPLLHCSHPPASPLRI